jgi:hypothetical protein
MTLDRLKELTCEFFKITKEQLESSGRGTDNIVIPKHCYRTLANSVYGFSHNELAYSTGHDPSSVAHSKRVILIDEQFQDEYLAFKAYVAHSDRSGVEKVVDSSGIERVTNDAYDERFYIDKKKLNKKTNNEYFPAFHFLTKLGSPEPIGLTKWRQDKGHFADYILERSAVIGSYVHDCIDRMIKSDSTVFHEDIHRDFPDAKEAHRVKECLLAFMNFIEIEEPIIVASEKMVCADDFGFTLDSEMLLKSDNYEKRSVVDWKTSKVANEDHKMQVETMRRVVGADKGVVVVLGNSTKKKYTATVIKPSEQDYLWNRFQSIKETAYVELLKRGTIKPREDNMPAIFGLRELNFKRKL